MSRKVINYMREWERSSARHSPTNVDWAETNKRSCFQQLDLPTPRTAKVDWEPADVPPRVEPVARCRVVAFEGDQAECTVFMDGYELPRVSFPAWVLRRKGLEIGARFHWIIRDPAHIRPADIDTDVPQSDELTAKEKAEYEQLYAKFKQRLEEDGGKWPEYSGPGR